MNQYRFILSFFPLNASPIAAAKAFCCSGFLIVSVKSVTFVTFGKSNVIWSIETFLVTFLSNGLTFVGLEKLATSLVKSGVTFIKSRISCTFSGLTNPSPLRTHARPSSSTGLIFAIPPVLKLASLTYLFRSAVFEPPDDGYLTPNFFARSFSPFSVNICGLLLPLGYTLS